MHDDEDGGVEHMSARDLEAEHRLKLKVQIFLEAFNLSHMWILAKLV